MLEAGHGTALTLVAAPAGYGKTTAVRAWCENRGSALAWVTLDAGDNDPGRLWRYAATAVDRVRPGLGRGALRRLGAPGGAIENSIDDLMNAVAAFATELEAEEIEMLCERTEGWPAALVLAGLWLRSVDDPSRAVREFGGDHRFVAEYLSNEVLASLDDELRSFLQSASVLGQFTPELCDGVLHRSDSASVLTDLERSNLFVRRLERGDWFRVHSLFAEYATAQLASLEPGAAAEIHRRAARWLRSRGLPVEAAGHAAAAGDHELVAQLLVEYHLPLIRNGGARTLLRWVRTLPDDSVVKHPELAVAGATAAAMAGQGTIEQRRLLQLADRAQAERLERSAPYVETVARMLRANTIDGGVGRAVLNGRRAVELAEAGADEILTGALAGYARALYFAGDLDDAWRSAMRALEHPEAERRVPSHALARSTLALVAVDRGRLASARSHAEKAKAAVGRIGTSRSWLGAHASAALGAVLAGEGKLAEAERELAYAEHYFRDEVATVHHAWLLVCLARVRERRGRLDEAEATLRAARAELEEIADSGRVPALANEVEQELEVARTRAGSGELLEPPSEAELAVLRLLATDLSMRQIGTSSSRTTRSIRTRARSTASSASAPVRTPSRGRLRSACFGKRFHGGDRRATGVAEEPGVPRSAIYD